MSTSMSSGGCPQTPVICTSSWLCDNELESILDVAYSDTVIGKDDHPIRDRGALLTPTQPSEAGSPCTLSLSCVLQKKDRILSLSIYSQARTIEVYSVVGQDEEYLGTSRGERFSICEKDISVTLYKTCLKLETPVLSCKIKLLSLGGKNSVFLSKISVQVTLVHERAPQPSPMLNSSINMDRVQSIMDSMGGKLSPGAEQLMSMVRSQQKHQAPFGAHLLQLFGGLDRAVDRELQKERVPDMTTKALDIADGTSQSQIQLNSSASPQNHGTPDCDLKTVFSSFLHKQMNTMAYAPNHNSLPQLLQNLHLEKDFPLRKERENGAESYQTSREENMVGTLEKLMSVHMERMERTLMDHIDQKMKSLQDHLDSRLNFIINAIHSSSSGSLSLTTAENLTNKLSDHKGEEHPYCNGLPSNCFSDLSTLS
ncbi:ATPase PAAT [Bombina bombina]|uniref:ATPase PAAT n=1 Tax=Bombina bombina TaxID=8345 RepID=UPI00235AC6BA|nr:ATPase PAAT [Bombina bombina]